MTGKLPQKTPCVRRNAENLIFKGKIPGHQRLGVYLETPSIKVEGQYKWPIQPTFQKAVEFAVQIRNQHPNLQDCPIVACTDLHQDTTYSGEHKMQRVLP